jgi:hypothetical protein
VKELQKVPFYYDKIQKTVLPLPSHRAVRLSCGHYISKEDASELLNDERTSAICWICCYISKIPVEGGNPLVESDRLSNKNTTIIIEDQKPPQRNQTQKPKSKVDVNDNLFVFGKSRIDVIKKKKSIIDNILDKNSKTDKKPKSFICKKCKKIVRGNHTFETIKDPIIFFDDGRKRKKKRICK